MGTTVTQSNPLYNKLEIVKVGTETINALVGQGTYSITNHNLGFVPMVIATAHSPNFPGTNRAMLAYVETPGTTTEVIAQIFNVTTTYIQFEVTLGSAASGHAGAWEIKYWLLRDTAT